MVVNLFLGFVYIVCHIMGVGYVWSCYLNCKEGGVEGRVSDWSEVVIR